MKKLAAVMVLLLSATVAFAGPRNFEDKIRIHDEDANGVPMFVRGQLGKLGTAGGPAKAAAEFMRSQRFLLKMAGSEDFEALNTIQDELGQTHIRLQERVNGLPVIGGEYIVHADRDGNVVAINGRLAVDKGLPRAPSMDALAALEQATMEAGIDNGSFTERPRLVYVVNQRSNTFLAWAVNVSYRAADGLDAVDTIYADATTGNLVMRNAKVKTARNRRTYTANNGSSLPGTLVLTETSGSTSDTAIQKAHDYAGVTYNYYSTVHGRDSYNGSGATITSSAHYSSGYNNAYWDGSQMVYGDGDGSTFTSLSKALDVCAHELTHAVTETSANLVYQDESGALNEATSDILGSSAEAWNDGSVNADTWKIGEDIYTPGTSGDALRYMNDPAAAGDKDYYPTRYTGTSDYGGVHTNSGIANLAYYMMVMGGTHPRGKTTVSVPALSSTALTSIQMASKIWYRALTVYMNSTTTFAGARTATANAATDLYGAAAANSVNKAWDAVGAPGGSGGGGGTTTTLSNGVAVTGISASTGSWKHYKITVPSGQSSLAIVMSGGTGDGDLYVKRGSQPTSSSYDYRPYLNGNNESVTVTNPAAGDWYISIYAYSTFSSVSLKATYSGAAACTSVSSSLSGTGASYYTTQYTSSASGAHTGKLTGPASGADFDLYLQKLSGSTWTSVAAGESSTANENVSYNGTSGTYRWRVYAYSGSGSFTLCTTKP